MLATPHTSASPASRLHQGMRLPSLFSRQGIKTRRFLISPILGHKHGGERFKWPLGATLGAGRGLRESGAVDEEPSVNSCKPHTYNCYKRLQASRKARKVTFYQSDSIHSSFGLLMWAKTRSQSLQGLPYSTIHKKLQCLVKTKKTEDSSI